MKKTLISILSTIFVAAMLLSVFSGCGAKNNDTSDSNTSDSGESSNSSKASEANDTEKPSDKIIDFSKLDWKVEEELINGERYPAFSYTNNSDVTICDFILVFKQKDSTTKEDLQLFSEAIEKLNISDDKLNNLNFTAESLLFTKPGETSRKETISIDSRIGYVLTSMEQYELIEPDYAKIAFIEGEYAYGMTYDFKNKKSKPEGNATKAYTWTDSELGKAIPKLECEATQIKEDTEDEFWLTGYNISDEMKKEYVDSCLGMGYTTDDINRGNIEFFKGNYKLEVEYSEYRKEIYICVKILSASELKEAESSRIESSKKEQELSEIHAEQERQLSEIYAEQERQMSEIYAEQEKQLSDNSDE